jgi:hypothetical protein
MAAERRGTVTLADVSLHFHSVKGRFAREVEEVADFLGPVCIALGAYGLYFQFTVIFPSWTSRVRFPSPAPFFQQLTDN